MKTITLHLHGNHAIANPNKENELRTVKQQTTITNRKTAHQLVGRLLVLLFIISLPLTSVYALQGAWQTHDPSSIIKNGNTYWIFTTGNGVYGMYSNDLVKWHSGPKTVFPVGTWPKWINTYAPKFAGHFWAPECIYMNGKYYLYYSCTSEFGSKQSVIGLATNVTLDPNSPSYRWVDEGMVVFSNDNSDHNAIDAALFWDASGRLWMTYGSFVNGIRITEINKSTGKPVSSTSFRIAGNNGNLNDREAPFIIRRGNYYYLFVNRGLCCKNAESSYYVQVGRSTSPTGPYLDKSGRDMNADGGTNFITRSGRYIGPGHIGYYVENGVEYLTYHFYDGDDNGNPKLHISNMKWDSSGWPVNSPEWLPNGRYKLINRNSNLAWDAWGCTGAQGQAVAQGSYAGHLCQQWDITSLGYGEYRITCAQGGLAVDASGCSPNNGTKLQLWAYSGANCQRWKIERTNEGSFVISSRNGNRTIEVPNGSTTAGTQLALWDYNEYPTQRWRIVAPTAATTASTQEAAAEQGELTDFKIYPNPAPKGKFIVELGDSEEPTSITVTNTQGKQVYSRQISGEYFVSVDRTLAAGIYFVKITRGDKQSTQKVVVQ